MGVGAPSPHPNCFYRSGALSTNAPPPESCLAAPEPGTGLLRSVVCQMKVLPSGGGPFLWPGPVRFNRDRVWRVRFGGSMAGAPPGTAEQAGL